MVSALGAAGVCLSLPVVRCTVKREEITMAAKQRVPRLAVTGVRATGLALGMVWAMGCRAGGFTAAATLDGVSNLKGGVDQKACCWVRLI